jgi:hypothetical protein
MIARHLGSRLSTSSSRLLEDATDHFVTARGGGTAVYKQDWFLKKVELITEHKGWPVGTVGVVIEPFEDAAVVEVSGGYGVTLGTFAVPYEDLEIVSSPVAA